MILSVANQSHRTKLKGVVKIRVCRVFIFLAVLLSFFSRVCWAQKDIKNHQKIVQAIETITTQIKNRYAVNIIYKDFQGSSLGTFVYSSASPEDYFAVLKSLYILKKEFKKYPFDFFQKVELKQIVLLKNFFRSEKPMEGLYTTSNTIFLDFYRKNNNVLLQKHTIHHEIFHILDHHIEKVYPSEESLWSNFNKKSFNYNDKESHVYIRNTSHQINRGQKGFITPYSMTSIKEDKAEIFACLMIESQRKILYIWMENDRILKNKVYYLKNYVSKIEEKYLFDQ